MALRREERRQDDLLVGCDAAQVEAITTEAQPLCILAGAGSGKTRVLTRRIAWRVLDGSATSGHVLALTFTRKAAAELRARLGALGLPEPVTAGTFHAIALAELRRLALERQQSPPVVLGSKVRLLRDVLDGRHRSRGRSGRPSPRDGAAARSGAGSPPLHELASEIEWAKACLVNPEGYEAAAQRARRASSWSPDAVTELYDAYEAERRRRGVLDFEDLLRSCADELEADAAFAASARWRLRHLFVDEYQDVNAAQLRLLDAWCSKDLDLCAVGDPHQAIYAWNGSDPDALVRFRDRFPTATVLRLDANYRSTSEVLSVAAAVLGHDAPPAVRGPSPEGPVPTVRAYASSTEEATGVAEQARVAHRPGRLWSQIVVLARTNAQLDAFEQAFKALGVPCRILGETSVLTRPHVATLLSELERARSPEAMAALAADAAASTSAASSEDGDDGEGIGTTGRQDQRLDDLRSLADLVEDYLATDPVPTGPGFRTFVETSIRRGDLGARSDSVELSTFHRAKGLEWPIVFVTGLEDGLVPIAHARDGAALEEERRLLYVACTRAEEELHCSWARTRTFTSGRPSSREPSPYLASIEQARRRLEQLSRRSPSAARRALEESRRALAGGPGPGPS